jgi:hypothetical protein
MSALIADIMTARITPQVSNAAVNAGGKLLKVVEMQHKYGQPGMDNDNHKSLQLVGEAA